MLSCHSVYDQLLNAIADVLEWCVAKEGVVPLSG